MNLAFAMLAAVGKGPYPFAVKQAQYARYDDRQLWHALQDAKKARDNAERTARAMEQQYGRNSGGAVTWRANAAFYSDDVHTILAERNKRRGVR